MSAAPLKPLPALTLRSARATAVQVPLRHVLGTSAGAVREAPLVLVDALTEQGIVGRSYVFVARVSGARSIMAVLHEAAGSIAGAPLAPADIAATLERRYALIGVTGIVRMALSALDAALWDALAIAAGWPLATLLGSAPRPLPAYNSCGLGLSNPSAAADEAERLLEGGFKAVKLRLGYPTLEADLAVTRAVRRRLPDEVHLMADYNQALTLYDALRRARALESEGLAWLEEPIRHDDLRGNSEIARAVELPLQIGENFNGPQAMMLALDAQACDLVMPDVARIGGVTGWMQSAAIASAAGMDLSSHLYPEVSAHLLLASETRHWLEYVDWADPILETPLIIEDGHAVVNNTPGVGLRWNAEAVARYTVA